MCSQAHLLNFDMSREPGAGTGGEGGEEGRGNAPLFGAGGGGRGGVY